MFGIKRRQKEIEEVRGSVAVLMERNMYFPSQVPDVRIYPNQVGWSPYGMASVRQYLLASEVIQRFDELYAYLGVERKHHASETKLEKCQPKSK